MDKSKFIEVLNKIKEYNRIIIHGHVRPDGDCIGSQYGLYEILKETFKDKEIYVTGEESDYVGFIGRPTLIDDSLFKGALSITVDTPIVSRLSDNRIDKSDFVIKFDHHPVVEDFADLSIVFDKRPACAEIIYDFYEALKDELKINKKAALALYVGISTDTGRFKFASVDSHTFYVASKLTEIGVDLAYVDLNLSIETEDAMHLRGYCLSSFKKTKNGVAYLYLDKKIQDKYNVTYEEAANMVNTLSTIKGSPMWVLFVDKEDEIRVRLRSRGPVVNNLAEKYEGGGHKLASGATLHSVNDIEIFLKDADLVIKEYKLTPNSYF